MVGHSTASPTKPANQLDFSVNRCSGHLALRPWIPLGDPDHEAAWVVVCCCRSGRTRRLPLRCRNVTLAAFNLSAEPLNVAVATCETRVRGSSIWRRRYWQASKARIDQHHVWSRREIPSFRSRVRSGRVLAGHRSSSKWMCKERAAPGSRTAGALPAVHRDSSAEG